MSTVCILHLTVILRETNTNTAIGAQFLQLAWRKFTCAFISCVPDIDFPLFAGKRI